MFKNPDIKAFLDQVLEFWQRRSTIRSLLAFLLVINVFLFSLVPLSYFVLKNIGLIKTPDKFFTFFLFSIALWFIINLIILVFWLSWRRVPSVSSTKIGIFFAPHSDPECKDLIYKLYEQFKLDLKRRRLTNEITYNLLPENQNIRDHNDAHDILHKSGARLIIYGHIQKGKMNGEMIEGFKKISFSVRHRELYEKERIPVLKNFAGGLAYRSFTIKDNNTWIEKDILIENISEVACFFIVMGLTLDGKVDKSIGILEHLLKVIQEKSISGKTISTNKTFQQFHDFMPHSCINK